MAWSRGRIINAGIWLYLWLSKVLAPVPLDSENYWSDKFLGFGPFDDIPRLMGRAVVPLILWFLIDSSIRWRTKRKMRQANPQ
jgi:hypothetical protein